MKAGEIVVTEGQLRLIPGSRIAIRSQGEGEKPISSQRQQGTTPSEAIREACLVRFRPIMMTTMAALVGTLPIALGYGAGAESRQPLGLAVVGGLLVSQLLTLYITPVYYVYIEGARLRLARRRHRPVAAAQERYPDSRESVAASR